MMHNRRRQDPQRAENSGRGGTLVRNAYLIDRFSVVYESGGGWHCVCADFVKTNACRHTREASGRAAAQAQIIEHLSKGRTGESQAGRPTMVYRSRGS
jgi:hypothetical protein